MRDLAELREYWSAHAGAELALCTLVRKQGSTYRRPGAKKIIARQGGGCGLLSGGCLEADIEETTRIRWGDMPFVHSFSTLSPEDNLLGYQAGCAGIIEVLFERLPMAGPDVALYLPFGREAKAEGVLVRVEGQNIGKRRFGARDEGDAAHFFDAWRRPVELFVIGCGIDAAPFAELARVLGWTVKFIDYRASLRSNLPADAAVTIAPLPTIAGLIGGGPQTAVILMTHNFNADLVVLQALGSRMGAPPAYIGCLGPRARFEEMMNVEGLPAAIAGAVQVPAGLFVNSHEPTAIALSIVAQIEAQLG